MADMSGKTVMITGGTSGIGEAMGHALAEMGAGIRVIGRDESRCHEAVEGIRRDTGNPDIQYYVADLSVQAQVRDVAQRLRNDLDRLDVLINNAGAWFTKRRVSADSIELTWALNHIAYFLLTNELLDLLKATAAEHGEARIINQSSSAHENASIHWDDIEFEQSWDTAGKGALGPGWAVYAQSKLANLLFTFALARHLEGTGVTANAAHPAVVVTRFSQNNGLLYKLAAPVRRLSNKRTPREGAQPALHLASAPEAHGVSGAYYGPPQREETPTAIAHDPATQDRLWRLSRTMIGERADAA